MEIEYLQELADNPNGSNFPNKPIPETEIAELGELYNAGKPFPKALRELLYLAGNYCYVLDYNIYNSQKELQESIRKDMQEFGVAINRPFYIIDNYCGYTMVFIYLDEGDDPPVYSSIVSENKHLTSSATLSQYINSLVERVKQGRNPF